MPRHLDQDYMALRQLACDQHQGIDALDLFRKNMPTYTMTPSRVKNDHKEVQKRE